MIVGPRNWLDTLALWIFFCFLFSARQRAQNTDRYRYHIWVPHLQVLAIAFTDPAHAAAYYVVTSVNGKGESNFSNQIAIGTLPTGNPILPAER